MSMEHLRENGNLAQGYYCALCGGPVGMLGHLGCDANPKLVKKLDEINQAGSMKQYVFNKLQEENNE